MNHEGFFHRECNEKSVLAVLLQKVDESRIEFICAV